MAKLWLAAVAAALATLGLLLSPAAGPAGFLLFLLTPLPLFLVGLSAGMMGIAIAGAMLAIATVPLGGFGGGIAVLGGLIVPVSILVRQALLNREGPDGTEWYPPGLLVAWLTGIGIALVGIGALFLAGQGGLETEMRGELERSLSIMAPQAAPQDIAAMADQVAGLALGAAVTGWVLILALAGSLAQGIAMRFGWALRPGADIAELGLPPWCGLALAVSALGAALLGGTAGFLAGNLVMVTAVPFFFAGLAVIHRLARRVGPTGIVLGLAYAAIVVLGWPALLVVGLGLVDQILNLARTGRPKGGNSGGDDEGEG